MPPRYPPRYSPLLIFFGGRPKDMIKGDFQSYPDHRRDGAGASCTDGGRMGSGHGLVKK